MDNIDHFYNNGISTQKSIFLKDHYIINTVNDRFLIREKQYENILIKKISKKYLDRIDEAYDSSIFAKFGPDIYEKLIFDDNNSIIMSLSKNTRYKYIMLKKNFLVEPDSFILHYNLQNIGSALIEQITNRKVIFVNRKNMDDFILEVLNSNKLPGIEEMVIPDIDGKFEYSCNGNYYVRNKFEYGSNKSDNYHVVKFSGDYYVSYHMEENKMLEGV